MSNQTKGKPPPPPHVAMVPTPWMGHFIPLLEFAKLLVSLPHHHFHVTIILPSDGSPLNPHREALQSLPSSISAVFLPPQSLDDLPESTKIETRISLTLTRSLPALRDSLKLLSRSTRLVAMVVDFFGMPAFEIAKQFGVLPYLFYPSNALLLSFFLHLPELDRSFPGEYRDMPEPLTLPGCVPVRGCDFPDVVQDRRVETYHRVCGRVKSYTSAAGILVNSFVDLEPGTFKDLKERNKPLVYPVGPIIRTGSTGESHGCLSWLDGQPEQSVVFVSFGSGWTLSHEQFIELALGLEVSEQRFLWVIRTPNGKDGVAKTHKIEEEDPCSFLPNGFLERTKGVGLVVPFWAPQVQVLSHGSTGGFVSHCGWNSTLESIVHGVPSIAWPLHAEQKMNAVFLCEDLKVGMRVESNDKGLVTRYEIEKHVKTLLKGEEGRLIRNKMKHLKDVAAMAMSEQGSSMTSLAQVANIWSNHKNNEPNEAASIS